MASAEPTILFVHGAWHRPTHYSSLIHALRTQGYSVVAPTLPTMNGARPATTALNDDVSCIQHEASSLVSAGNTVLVVCHSYGGFVTTNALTSDLSLARRQKEGKKGGVMGLLYLCAFIPHKGQMLNDIIMNSGAVLVPTIHDDGTLIPSNPVEAFYADVEPEQAKALAEKIDVHPLAAHTMRTDHEAWRYFPVTYVYCEDDRAIVIRRQRDMVGHVKSQGLKVRELSLKSSHSPFVSVPEKVVELIGTACEKSAVGA